MDDAEWSAIRVVAAGGDRRAGGAVDPALCAALQLAPELAARLQERRRAPPTAPPLAAAAPDSWEDAAAAAAATPAAPGAAATDAAAPAPEDERDESPPPPAPASPIDFDFEAAPDGDGGWDAYGGDDGGSGDGDGDGEIDTRFRRAMLAASGDGGRGNVARLYSEARSILNQFEALAAGMGLQSAPASGPLGAGLAALLGEAGIALPPADDDEDDAAGGGALHDAQRSHGSDSLSQLRSDGAGGGGGGGGGAGLSVAASVRRMRAQLERLRPPSAGGRGEEHAGAAAAAAADDHYDSAAGGAAAAPRTLGGAAPGAVSDSASSAPVEADVGDADGDDAGEGLAGAPLLLLDVGRFACDVLAPASAAALTPATAAGIVRQVWEVLTGRPAYVPPAPPAPAPAPAPVSTRRLGGLGYNPYARSEAAAGGGGGSGGATHAPPPRDLAPLTRDEVDADAVACHVHAGGQALLRMGAGDRAGVGWVRVHLAAPLPPPPPAARGDDSSQLLLSLPSTHRGDDSGGSPPLRFPALDVPAGVWAAGCEQLLAAGYARHSCSDTAESDVAAALASSAGAAGGAAGVVALLPYPTRLGGVATSVLWSRVALPSWGPPPLPICAPSMVEAAEAARERDEEAARTAVEGVRQALEGAHRDLAWKARAVRALASLADDAWRRRRPSLEEAASSVSAHSPDAAGVLLDALQAVDAGSGGDEAAPHALALLDVACGAADEATALLAARAAASPLLRLLLPLLDRVAPQQPRAWSDGSAAPLSPAPAAGASSPSPTGSGEAAHDASDDSDAERAALSRQRRAETVAAVALHAAAVRTAAWAASAASDGSGGCGSSSGAAPGVAAWCLDAAPAVVDLLAQWLRGFGRL